MNHEKIIVKENGDKVKLRIDFFILSLSKPSYKITMYLCEKGKRKYNEVKFDSYEYRKLTMEERSGFEYQKFLEYLSEEEIHQAKLEVWEKLKPIKGEKL